MINRDLFGLRAGLQAVGNLRGAKFVYAAAKNSRMIDNEIKALQKASQPDAAFMEFDKQRHKLCQEYALTGGDGKAKVNGGNYAIDPARQEEFDDKLADLREEHGTAIAAREKQQEEFEALLDEECELELHKVAQEHLPEDITAAQLTGILDMVED